MHSLGVPFKNAVAYLCTNPGACFCLGGRGRRGIKSPCGNGHTRSLVLGKDQSRSRTRWRRGASSACQPTGQSDDGGPFGQSIPRPEPSFSDTKNTFVDPFQQRETTFSDIISNTGTHFFGHVMELSVWKWMNMNRADGAHLFGWVYTSQSTHAKKYLKKHVFGRSAVEIQKFVKQPKTTQNGFAYSGKS